MLAVNAPVDAGRFVAGTFDAAAAFTPPPPMGPGAAEAVSVCAAGAAGAIDPTVLAAGGWLSTKVSVIPGGRTTRWPTATAATMGGTFFGLPNPPRTEFNGFAALPAAF